MFTECYEENEFRKKLKELFQNANYQHKNQEILEEVVSNGDSVSTKSLMMFMDYLIDKEKACHMEEK